MVQFSKNVKKKSSERIDEVSDPLYFLKDQTSHYINIGYAFLFQKRSFTKKAFLLPICQLPQYIYIYIYIYTVRGGLGQNFRPGNLTRIQAIPYTHNKF